MNEFNFYLSIVHSESQDAPISIKTIEKIDASELQLHHKKIGEYKHSIDLIRAVQLNNQDFIRAIVYYAADFSKSRNMTDSKLNEISINLSRSLLNTLSLSRSFLDHSDNSISKIFGKSSKQFVEWRDFQSNIFDTNSAYRLFYRLRNFCQHVGMPPLNVILTDIDAEGKISLKLSLVKASLLVDNFDWGKHVSKDLSQAEDHIPVITLLDDWYECFRKISVYLLTIKRDYSIESAQQILKYRSLCDSMNLKGKMCAIDFPPGTDSINELKLKMLWLAEEDSFAIYNYVHIKELEYQKK